MLLVIFKKLSSLKNYINFDKKKLLLVKQGQISHALQISNVLVINPLRCIIAFYYTNIFVV